MQALAFDGIFYMGNFINYSELIDLNSSADYWSDHAIDLAIECLDSFELKDWNLLNDNLNNRNPDWQVKCAETMSEATPKEGLRILFALLETGNRDVLEAVLDSMNALRQLGVEILFSEKQSRIVKQAAEQGGIVGQLAKRLIC